MDAKLLNSLGIAVQLIAAGYMVWAAWRTAGKLKSLPMAYDTFVASIELVGSPPSLPRKPWWMP